MSYKIKSLVYLVCLVITALTYYALDKETSVANTNMVQVSSDMNSTTSVN